MKSFLIIILSGLLVLPTPVEDIKNPNNITQEIPLLRRAYRQFLGINDSIIQEDPEAAAIHAGRFNRLISRLEKEIPQREFKELIDLSGQIMISRTLDEQYSYFLLLRDEFIPVIRSAGIEDDFSRHHH